MRNRINKFICLLMAVFVYIAGMYSENQKIHLTYACAPVTDVRDADFFTEDYAFTDLQVCTSDMLGVRENAEQITTRLKVHGREIISFPDFTYHKICFPYIGKSSAGFADTVYVSNCQSGLVIKYIHKSDGKKRI